MRSGVILLLLATISSPALAARDDNERADREAARAERKAERTEARSEQQSQGQPKQAQPRVERVQRSEPQVQLRSIERGGAGNGLVVREQSHHQGMGHEPMLERRSGSNPQLDPHRPALVQGARSVDSVREWRGRERHSDQSPAVLPQRVGSSDEWKARERRVGDGPKAIEWHNEGNRDGQQGRHLRIRERGSVGTVGVPIISRTPRQGTQPPPRRSIRPSSLSTSHWNHNWRSDGRHDWQNHRRRHHSLFHFSFYHDPFGWGYRPYSIGWRMWPSYYRSNYWLNDPWQYRLPYAPAGYRWVRYYDDAILVDTWDGQVVDVIRNFFW